MTTTIARKLILLCALSLTALQAQNPEDPPPWWNIADNDTVSLFWDFNNSVTPLQPTTQILPAWYTPLPLSTNNFNFTNSANITWLASVNGQPGVMGFTGTGAGTTSGTISQLVDNDPRPYWIKIFTMQYDWIAVGTSTVAAEVAKDLVKYERGIISEDSKPLGNGWTRTTISMYLIPQPVDETVDFFLSEAAANTVAIDNLFINSRCVKPPPDKVGTALGEVDTALLNVNLTTATGATCTSVAATEDPQTQALTFWVAGRTTGNVDQIFRLNVAGGPAGSPVLLPSPVASLEGASDLAIAVQPVPISPQTFVHGVLDRRASNNTVAIVAIDAATGQIVPAQNITVNGFGGPGPLGLAFSPHGQLGAGTFWISDQAGNVTEVARNGAILRTLTPAANGTPLGISGATYDPFTGKFYWFSRAPTPTPQGPLQIAGFEHDGYSMQPTGNVFFGDLDVPNPGGPRGGLARGLEILRLSNGQMRLLCVQQVGNQSVLSVLKGPFQFGYSLLGRCGMRNGAPMQGNLNWEVTLRGVPHATIAIPFLGFDNQLHLGLPLPIALAPIGMDESYLSISPAILLPGAVVNNGNASVTIALPPPPPPFLHDVPLFFQWLVFDRVVGLAASQAGETVVY